MTRLMRPGEKSAHAGNCNDGTIDYPTSWNLAVDSFPIGKESLLASGQDTYGPYRINIQDRTSISCMITCVNSIWTGAYENV
jgi:hypothetical protein